MIKSKLIILFFIILYSIDGKASLYEAIRSFDQNDEIHYSVWVKDKLTQDIFSNPISPYYGIKTDCADAAFALRAIYAFENKLSFQFSENEGKILTEKTSMFDNLSSDIEKLKAFIAYIGENAGSEALASDNTHPIDLKSIRPGDLYITRWKNQSGEFTRHVYIIKEILPTGDLVLYSSTTPRAVRPLLPRKGMPLRMFTERPFGFRRFKFDLKMDNSKFDDFSNIQYEAMKLGEEKFFKLVKDSLKTAEDTLELNIERHAENICVALKTRVTVVETALAAKRKNAKACFNKESFDEYSSPSRDRNIISDIERLRNGYRTIVKRNMEVELSDSTKLALDFLIAENKSEEASSALKSLCAIIIDTNRGRVSMNIKSFYDRYKAGMVSSNPNDSLESRWGLIKSENKCPVY